MTPSFKTLAPAVVLGLFCALVATEATGQQAQPDTPQDATYEVSCGAINTLTQDTQTTAVITDAQGVVACNGSYITLHNNGPTAFPFGFGMAIDQSINPGETKTIRLELPRVRGSRPATRIVLRTHPRPTTNTTTTPVVSGSGNNSSGTTTSDSGGASSCPMPVCPEGLKLTEHNGVPRCECPAAFTWNASTLQCQRNAPEPTQSTQSTQTPPPQACPQGASWNGTNCVCNSSTPLWNARAGLCEACPRATPNWDGYQCSRCPANAPALANGQCLACPAGSRWDGRGCLQTPSAPWNH